MQQLEVSAKQDRERLQDQEKQYQQLIEPIRLALEVDAQIQTQQVRLESRQQEQTRLEQTIHQQRQQLLQEDAWVQQAVLRQQQRQHGKEHADCQQLERALPDAVFGSNGNKNSSNGNKARLLLIDGETTSRRCQAVLGASAAGK